MRTISDIKARMKMAMFYFMDVVALALTYLVGDKLQDMIQFRFPMYVLFQVVNLGVCLFLCLPARSNPTRNNASALFLFFTRDKRQFLSQDYLFIKRKGKGED